MIFYFINKAKISLFCSIFVTKKIDSMDITKFKHTLPIQVRFNDVDSFGHVNNTIYFSFYDLGKTTYFDEVRRQFPELSDIAAVIVNAQVDFLLPVYMAEQIAVQTAVIEIGNKSFKLQQQVINTKTGEVKCVCRTIMVGFDKKSSTSQPIPDEWKTAITEFEGGEALG